MKIIHSSSVEVVVQQHVEDAIMLRNTRGTLARAPHVQLLQLGRLDERLEAHLDGISIAGDMAWEHCQTELEDAGTGQVFVVAVQAIHHRDMATIEKLLSLAEGMEEARRGLVSAFGWVAPATLKGTTKRLLDAPNPFWQEVGLATCAMHHVDPGPLLEAALRERGSRLAARALVAAGNSGRVELLPLCRDHLDGTDPQHRFLAARSALLLGDRHAATDALRELSLAPGDFQGQALALFLKVVLPPEAQQTLQDAATNGAPARVFIDGIAHAGDPAHVPWLIQQMEDPCLARLAGQSFSFITGLDLAYLDLDRKPPEDVPDTVNDDPEDDEVAMDEDENLPWPDQGKIAGWWQANGSRFAPGVRHFVGGQPSLPHCLDVLKNGFQRQRIAASHALCLLQPGTALFNTAAPAWRQSRLLK
jgi:uncharacterized protein (TIGR02270 family)